MSSPWSAQPFVPAGYFDPDAVVEFVPKTGGSNPEPFKPLSPQEQPWKVEGALYVNVASHSLFSPCLTRFRRQQPDNVRDNDLHCVSVCGYFFRLQVHCAAGSAATAAAPAAASHGRKW